jgi:hypothetical protein
VIAFVATMFIGVTYVIGKALFEKIAEGLAKDSVTPAAWDEEKGALAKKGGGKNSKKDDKTQSTPPQIGGGADGAWSDKDA